MCVCVCVCVSLNIVQQISSQQTHTQKHKDTCIIPISSATDELLKIRAKNMYPRYPRVQLHISLRLSLEQLASNCYRAYYK